MGLFSTEIFLIIDRSKNNLKKKSIKHIYNVLWILKVTPEGTLYIQNTQFRQASKIGQ